MSGANIQSLGQPVAGLWSGLDQRQRNPQEIQLWEQVREEDQGWRRQSPVHERLSGAGLAPKRKTAEGVPVGLGASSPKRKVYLTRVKELNRVM